MPKKNVPSYEEALSELESIVTAIEGGNLPIEQLTPRLSRAQELLALCKQKLEQVNTDVKKILDNESEQMGKICGDGDLCTRR